MFVRLCLVRPSVRFVRLFCSSLLSVFMSILSVSFDRDPLHWAIVRQWVFPPNANVNLRALPFRKWKMRAVGWALGPWATSSSFAAATDEANASILSRSSTQSTSFGSICLTCQRRGDNLLFLSLGREKLSLWEDVKIDVD